MKQEKPNLTDIYRPQLEDIQTLSRATYPIKAKWDVTVEIIGSDDETVVQLNEHTVLIQRFGESPKRISLQNILKLGNNTLRITLYNIHPPYCSIHYKIGVYDENGKPRYDAIDIPLVGKTPHQGAQWDIYYEFPKS